MPKANSYTTVEQATEYLNGLLGTEMWAKAEESDKERALASATLRIDALEGTGGGFRGRRTDPGQPLAFPRAPDVEVPEAVKNACALEAAALFENAADPASSSRERAIRQGVASASVGGASESYRSLSELRGGMRGRLASDMALALLAPYMAAKGVYPIR